MVYMSGYEEQRREEFELAPEVFRRKKHQRQVDFKVERDLLPHQIVLGGKPIGLEPVEYKFLTFLAQKPYHAFSKREILNELNDGTLPEDQTEESLRSLVRSLRDKLGFFWDFVQPVPYIGYRFKP